LRAEASKQKRTSVICGVLRGVMRDTQERYRLTQQTRNDEGEGTRGTCRSSRRSCRKTPKMQNL
jgi:hypothetical protein